LTRVRAQHFLQIPDGEYNLVQFDGQGHWVVRDDTGDVLTAEESIRTTMLVRCDYCRQWVDHAAPAPQGWRCYGGDGRCDPRLSVD
jgi:hypothetical protein